eukprot:Pgem_evm1s9988
MILGNKCDMTEKRQVSTEAGEQLALEYNITLMETSAKANINIEDAFTLMAKNIKKKMDSKAQNKTAGGASGGQGVTVNPASQQSSGG